MSNQLRAAHSIAININVTETIPMHVLIVNLFHINTERNISKDVVPSQNF